MPLATNVPTLEELRRFNGRSADPRKLDVRKGGDSGHKPGDPNAVMDDIFRPVLQSIGQEVQKGAAVDSYKVGIVDEDGKVAVEMTMNAEQLERVMTAKSIGIRDSSGRLIDVATMKEPVRTPNDCFGNLFSPAGVN